MIRAGKMKAICLFSGGKDSTVALAWSVANYAEVIALSFNYPARPTSERVAAREVSARLLVRYIEVELPFIKIAAEIASGLGGPPQTEAAYSPMRNLVFHSIALSVAETLRAEVIVAGHIKSDGNAYRDATRDYLEAIYTVANSGTYPFGGRPAARIELQLPLIDRTDAEVLILGETLSAPVEFSWSCLLDGPEPCKLCVSCKDRERAIYLAAQQNVRREVSAERTEG
jgi:7-cyano-7-deazaguanine synthase